MCFLSHHVISFMIPFSSEIGSFVDLSHGSGSTNSISINKILVLTSSRDSIFLDYSISLFLSELYCSIEKTFAFSSFSGAEQLWVLDSVPGEVNSDETNGEVEKVLLTLQSLPSPLPSRKYAPCY